MREELNDDHYIKETDIWLNDFLIEFINERFICNGEIVTHEQMIDTIDFIMDLNHGIQGHKKARKVFIDIFNMKVDINVLEDMFRKFEPNI